MSGDLQREIIITLATQPLLTMKRLSAAVAKRLDVDSPGHAFEKSIVRALQCLWEDRFVAFQDDDLYYVTPQGLEAFVHALEPAKIAYPTADKAKHAQNVQVFCAVDVALRDYIQSLNDPKLTALFNARVELGKRVNEESAL